MNQLNLCSGVGVGFSLAGLRLGFSLIGVSEVDPFCSEILSLRYPGVKNYGDVKGISKVFQSTDRLHLLTTSPPCQPFSVRGKRKGSEDPRDCFPHVLRASGIPVGWTDPQDKRSVSEFLRGTEQLETGE